MWNDAHIKGYGLGPYNRTLGVIHMNGKDINMEMVKAGLAEVYRGRPPRGLDLGPFWKAEEEARKAKRGMWSLGEKYVSPKDWRHRDSNYPIRKREGGMPQENTPFSKIALEIQIHNQA